MHSSLRRRHHQPSKSAPRQQNHRPSTLSRRCPPKTSHSPSTRIIWKWKNESSRLTWAFRVSFIFWPTESHDSDVANSPRAQRVLEFDWKRDWQAMQKNDLVEVRVQFTSFPVKLFQVISTLSRQLSQAEENADSFTAIKVQFQPTGTSNKLLEWTWWEPHFDKFVPRLEW